MFLTLRSSSCKGAHWHQLGRSSRYGHWYSLSRQRGTFYQAEKYCASIGGQVVEINSESEYLLVTRKIGTITIQLSAFTMTVKGINN